MYRWMEHTGELELEIDAPTPTAVFEDALCAVAELLGDERAGDPRVCDVVCSAPDRGALLAEWLEELVFLAETEDLVPDEGARDLVVGEDSVTAVVVGRTGEPRHLVKAVTYHDLGVRLPAMAAARGWCSMSELGARRHALGDPGRRPAGHARARRGCSPIGELLEAIAADRSLEQLQNVATLPGIVGAALAMPDIHQGYGFPVGGVAATEPPDGVVSPGGVGYDINCGVRLLALPLTGGRAGRAARARSCTRSRARVPAGAGHGTARSQLDGRGRSTGCCVEGPRACWSSTGSAPRRTSSAPSRRVASPAPTRPTVSERARERGAGQLGTLGSGNHFVEVQRVERILDPAAAEAFGLREGQVTVLIHSGSRGLGHQVCTDYVKRDGRGAPAATGSCCPTASSPARRSSSPEGQRVPRGDGGAANFAWANRQAIAHRVREAIAAIARPRGRARARARSTTSPTTSPSSRSTAAARLCVHRKGATRAFPRGLARDPGRLPRRRPAGLHPRQHGHGELRARRRRPGAMERSFGTTCHGAGRRMSRTGAATPDHRRRAAPRSSRRRASSCAARRNRGLAEEAPFAYKDVERVVAVVERAGLAGRVAQLRPLGVVKG